MLGRALVRQNCVVTFTKSENLTPFATTGKKGCDLFEAPEKPPKPDFCTDKHGHNQVVMRLSSRSRSNFQDFPSGPLKSCPTLDEEDLSTHSWALKAESSSIFLLIPAHPANFRTVLRYNRASPSTAFKPAQATSLS